VNRVRNLRAVLLSVLVATGMLVAPGVSTPAAAVPPFCAFVTPNRTDGTLRCTGQVMKFVGVNVRDLVFLDDVMAQERARLANPPRTSPNATDIRDGQRDLYHQLEAAAGMKADVMRVFLARDDYGPTNFPGTTSVTIGGVATQVPNGFIAMGNKLAALFAFADVGHPALNDSGSNRYDNPPALGMKFQVSFTDSLIGPRPVNYVLEQDRPMYTKPSGDLRLLEYEWFTPEPAGQNTRLNYEDHYLPFVRYIVHRFSADHHVFGWQLGNEFKTANADTLVDFSRRMVREVKALDTNHMLTLGLLSVFHAIFRFDPPPAQVPFPDYGSYANEQAILNALFLGPDPLDLGYFHAYNNDWAPTYDPNFSVLQASVLAAGANQVTNAVHEIAWYKANNIPYILGEFGMNGGQQSPSACTERNNYDFGDPTYSWFKGGTWGGVQLPNIQYDRSPAIKPILDKFFGSESLDGLLQWGFEAGAFPVPGGDICKGMNDYYALSSNTGNGFKDWYTIEPLYRCRNEAFDGISSESCRFLAEFVDSANPADPPRFVRYDGYGVDEPGRFHRIWVPGSPDLNGIGADEVFSVRWTGSITIPTTGRYQFWSAASGPVRMDLNGTTIINGGPFSGTAPTAPIFLAAGEHNVTITYQAMFGIMPGTTTRGTWLDLYWAELACPGSAGCVSQYPYGITSVATTPADVDGTVDLPLLFDGITEHPNYGIISFSPGPIGVTMAFGSSVTLDGFMTAIGGETGFPDGYSWRVEADPEGDGTFVTVVPEQRSDAELVHIPFPSAVTARAFRIVHERFTGDGVEHLREIMPMFVGTGPTGVLGGLVHVDSATPGNVVAGALVQICPTGGACRVDVTDASGRYLVSVPAGQYTVTAFPPAGASLFQGQVGPVTVVANASNAAPPVILRSPTPPPAGTTISSVDTTPAGIPVVFWAEPLTLTTQGCAGADASYQIFDGATIIRSGTMTESPAGTYRATIAPLQPNHGLARVRIVLDCPTGPTTATLFDIYIDPSGLVRTVAGDPVAGATVTLYRSDTPDGPFTLVPHGSALMSPKNRANPDTTDAEGHFGWDVVAGFYKVRAERAGCRAPDDPDRAYVESAVLTIPPPVTDLDLRLDCPVDGTPPTTAAEVVPAANTDGWHRTDPGVRLTATDEPGGSGLAALSFEASGAMVVARTQVPATVVLVPVTAEGVTVVTYGATDLAGNAAIPGTVTVRVDRTAPTVDITVPAPGVSYPHAGSLALAATVTDALSGVASASATLDGQPVDPAGSVDLLTLSLGTHTLTVTATDRAGNQVIATRSFTVVATTASLVAATQQACQRGWITQPLTCTTLRSAAQATQLLAQAGQLAAARMTLGLYLTTLDLERGRSITEEGYQVLRADALAVRATL
jgi:hypothetical protein